MIYIYTAFFTQEGNKVFARVPDLPGCITSGYDLQDAITQITDAASGWLVVAEDSGDPIPAPTPQSEIEREDGCSVSFISVDTIAYRALTDTRSVRKNVSLPQWMVTLADKRGINCSQVLQAGLLHQFENV
ncbi:MAG: type II toxin-antitoxin system HicB family antitoxin [Lachnospiraceae bacterium]|nr:type II toxin-antitoxin system HicB family antitoxin [Lachnospiraceae bacterium]